MSDIDTIPSIPEIPSIPSVPSIPSTARGEEIDPDFVDPDEVQNIPLWQYLYQNKGEPPIFQGDWNVYRNPAKRKQFVDTLVKYISKLDTRTRPSYEEQELPRIIDQFLLEQSDQFLGWINANIDKIRMKPAVQRFMEKLRRQESVSAQDTKELTTILMKEIALAGF